LGFNKFPKNYRIGLFDDYVENGLVELCSHFNLRFNFFAGFLLSRENEKKMAEFAFDSDNSSVLD